MSEYIKKSNIIKRMQKMYFPKTYEDMESNIKAMPGDMTKGPDEIIKRYVCRKCIEKKFCEKTGLRTSCRKYNDENNWMRG